MHIKNPQCTHIKHFSNFGLRHDTSNCITVQLELKHHLAQLDGATATGRGGGGGGGGGRRCVSVAHSGGT